MYFSVRYPSLLALGPDSNSAICLGPFWTVESRRKVQRGKWHGIKQTTTRHLFTCESCRALPRSTSAGHVHVGRLPLSTALRRCLPANGCKSAMIVTVELQINFSKCMNVQIGNLKRMRVDCMSVMEAHGSHSYGSSAEGSGLSFVILWNLSKTGTGKCLSVKVWVSFPGHFHSFLP